MRVIKLNIAKEFPTFEKLKHYFEYDLPSRNPPGKFLLPKGWIAEDGLQPGERILFSYRCYIRFVAYSVSGRMKNYNQDQIRYPYFFVINLPARRVNFSLQSLEDRLKREKGNVKCIVRTQGWPKISDTKITKSIVESLINEYGEINKG